MVAKKKPKKSCKPVFDEPVPVDDEGNPTVPRWDKNKGPNPCCKGSVPPTEEEDPTGRIRELWYHYRDQYCPVGNPSPPLDPDPGPRPPKGKSDPSIGEAHKKKRVDEIADKLDRLADPPSLPRSNGSSRPPDLFGGDRSSESKYREEQEAAERDRLKKKYPDLDRSKPVNGSWFNWRFW